MPYGTQTPRFADALQRAFGIQGHLPLQLVDDLFPFIDLGNLPPDFAGHADVQRFYLRTITAAGGAGQYCRAKVVNESLNRVVVVESLDLESTQPTMAQLLFSQGAAAGGFVQAYPTDTLYGGQTPVAPNGRTDTVGIAGSPSDLPVRAISTSDPWQQARLTPFVLWPGWGCIFTLVQDNIQLAMRASGYTRPITPSEWP